MQKFIETLKNIWAIDELKNRILITLFFLAIYRLGAQVVLPGVDYNIIADAKIARGNFYKQLNKLKLSMADFDKVILESKQTNNQKIYHEALYNKSLLKLLCGEFEEGWKLYENRFYIDQHENFERFKTEKIFRARLYELERSRIDQERSQDRKTKIGTGDRSERIRTYNFPQGRVTDHRINLTLHKLEEFLEGEVFDEMIESLTLQAQEESLSNLK